MNWNREKARCKNSEWACSVDADKISGRHKNKPHALNETHVAKKAEIDA